MNLPSPLQFRAADYPELPARFLEVLNRGLRVLTEVIARVPELGQAEDVSFMSAASGNSLAEVKIATANRPKHVQVTMLRRNDGADITAVWSFTWSLSASTIKLSFQGLPVSVKCRFSVEYR